MAARFVWGGLTLVFLLGLFLIRSAASPWAAPSRLLLILTVACAVLFILSMLRHPITASERAALAVTAPAPSPIPAAEPMPDPELDEELQAAREQLRQATEAFAFLEARMKDGAATASASADVEAATKRIAELESALHRAEAEAEADGEAEAMRVRLTEAEERAQQASEPSDPDELIAELEAQVALAEARAKEAGDEALHRSPEANDLRARLARSAAKKKLGPTG